jgi:hypothetical protein
MGTDLSGCGARNFQESFLLAHSAGWFLILKVLFGVGVDCDLFDVLIMGHLEIQVALNFEVSE